MEYRIYAALHEETDKGWVWFLIPGFTSRMTVRIANGANRVYCEYREIDSNFRTLYHERPYTQKIPPNAQNPLVISAWYRRALSISDSDQSCDLEIEKPWWAAWADLRAACQHPEPGVRIATRLGILGTWLGAVGLLIAVKDLAGAFSTWGVLAAAGIAAGVSWIAGHGIKHRG